MGKILKVSCYRNYCIDFNQILHNDRDHQQVVVGGPNRRPTNLRWRTAAILKKPLHRHISATVDRFWWILVQWRTVASYSGSIVTISNFWKSKMAAAAILKNHKNRDISVTVWPNFIKFGTLMQNMSLNCYDYKKFEFHKSNMADGRHFKNR